MAIKTGPAWVNLHVKDLKRTEKFYKSLGFKLNGKPNEQLVSFLVGANEMVVHFFQQKIFEKATKGKASDALKTNEIIITIGSKSKKQIHAIADKVKVAGGKVFDEPSESEEGFYGCGFADIDGHKWNLLLIK